MIQNTHAFLSSSFVLVTKGKRGVSKMVYENKMVIDVNLYLKNENEEIHRP